MLIVNFKAYSQGTGRDSVELAEKCIAAARDTGEKLILSVQPEDLLRLEEKDVEVFAQHIDPVEPGSHTGHVLAEGVRDAGASGTLINHSERRLEKEEIEQAVERAEELGLTTVVCAQSPEECEELSELEPDYIAFEPPELIGGDVAVSTAKPELIDEAVERSEVEVLAGAGIKDTEDVERAIEQGCSGVLVASGVVKAGDPEESARRLMEGL
ncbi:MAG: triose-phosphate isomerase [Candidatus Nanohaloarchaea archaeon]